MYPDQEIEALSKVNDALKGLTKPQVMRTIAWITAKFGLDKPGQLTPGPEGEGVGVSTPAGPVKITQPGGEPMELPIKKRRGRKAKEKQAGLAVSGLPPVVPGTQNGFMRYETIDDFFSMASARTFADKIVLVGAFLQEVRQLKEFKTFDIIAILKKLGEKTGNISSAINSMLRKKKPELRQTGRLGLSRRAGRSFVLTEEGLIKARGYLPGK